MNARWHAAVRRGLGDRKTRTIGVLLILIGAFVKLIFLRNEANFETIFAVTLIAGSMLGRWWTVLVPMATLAIVEPFLWGGPYALYGSTIILGLTFFMVTGFLFVGLLGRALKPRVLFRVKSVALLTTVSIPLTIAYDLWTDVGEYYLIAQPMGLTFWNVVLLQIPFTAYHLLSSLIFVPLLGMGMLYLSAVVWPATEESTSKEPSDPAKPASDR